MNMQFPMTELSAIDKADDLKIAPFRADGKTYGTPTWIWAVMVDGELFVRAYNGVSSRWHRSAIEQGAGRIYAAGMTKKVAFEPVNDHSLNDRIDEAYQHKYRKSPYLSSMIGSRAKAATIRIVPLNE
jgi:hypothetical protein